MPLTIRLLVSQPGSLPEGLSVGISPLHRVSDLVSALAAFPGGQGDFHLAIAGGPVLDPAVPIARSPIRQGDHLLLVERGYRPTVPPRAALELRVLSGAAAGLRLPLSAGRHSLGRA